MSAESKLQFKPETASERLLPEQWADLSRGDTVWVHEEGWGYDAGKVDEVSRHHELLWIELMGRGRRLIRGGDPVQVWARG